MAGGVSAGGVWKSTNGGISFSPIFDGQGSFSIGTVTIDPANPNVVWVGTGENNAQRAVNYGDGVYGGVFISAMYAAAFFEKDPVKIVRAGVAMLPPESLTARSLNDLLRLHQENSTDWQKTWAEYNKLWDEKDEPCPEGLKGPRLAVVGSRT